MKFSAAKGTRSLKNLLLFAAYLAALWGTSWYNLHYCGGTYNTVLTDILLSIAFAAAFFYPIAAPQKQHKVITTAISSIALAAAALCLFILHA